MNDLPVRARILSAFKDESSVLTRRDVLEAARTTDAHELRLALDDGQVRLDGPAYAITPRGVDRLHRYLDFHALVS